MKYNQPKNNEHAKCQSALCKKKKILIVEDEGDMCLLLNIILKDKEVELDHVKSLAAADVYLQEKQPSL
ncbi:MAG: response regulator, partial [Bacteroidota bacterium]|nr:response regulator [Bacteroidota bacterium]